MHTFREQNWIENKKKNTYPVNGRELNCKETNNSKSKVQSSIRYVRFGGTEYLVVLCTNQAIENIHCQRWGEKGKRGSTSKYEMQDKEGGNRME